MTCITGIKFQKTFDLEIDAFFNINLKFSFCLTYIHMTTHTQEMQTYAQKLKRFIL